MQDIVNKYVSPESPYLLPIIRDTHADARLQYKNAIHLVNNKLKLIGKEIGLGIPLTTYVARHGWASIAKHKIYLLELSVKLSVTIPRKQPVSILIRWILQLLIKPIARF